MGRQILDGVSECIHSRRRQDSRSYMQKLIWEKPMTVQWNFLCYMMSRMGFGTKWRRWINECVFAHFSILVNGASKGFFPAQRGLRL